MRIDEVGQKHIVSPAGNTQRDRHDNSADNERCRPRSGRTAAILGQSCRAGPPQGRYRFTCLTFYIVPLLAALLPDRVSQE